MAPLVVGLSGPALLPDEAAFLARVRPVGIILFGRNVTTAEAVTALVRDARDACNPAFVLMDQEGGRVQRLRPPLAQRMPAAAAIGAVYAKNPEAGERAAYLAGRLIAADLAPYGINMPCLPVADVPVPGGHDVIGDRAYADDPAAVARLAGAAIAGVLAGGAIPVMKHCPGHGRAMVDSHFDLPRVTADRAALETDFAPFRALSACPAAMTAHLLYEAIDGARPGTLSPVVTALIREEIGFDGLLMTDDISMEALSGGVADRGVAALEAGVDVVLHCNGDFDEMRALGEALPPITAAADARVARALAARSAPTVHDVDGLRAEFAACLNAP
ncbi:MAG: beta-N-acetylhexosaminidase [Pseudomonadota bacterium]